jgi:hypothetical protein
MFDMGSIQANAAAVHPANGPLIFAVRRTSKREPACKLDRLGRSLSSNHINHVERSMYKEDKQNEVQIMRYRKSVCNGL